MIIAAGLVAVMLLAGRGVARGTMTIGDFVLVNSYLVQLYAPLNVLGMVYRNIKQSLTDLESMFRLLDGRRPRSQDRPGAPRPPRRRAARSSSTTSPSATTRAGRSSTTSQFCVPPGGTVAIVGPRGRRQIDNRAPPLPLLRRR